MALTFLAARAEREICNAMAHSRTRRWQISSEEVIFLLREESCGYAFWYKRPQAFNMQELLPFELLWFQEWRASRD